MIAKGVHHVSFAVSDLERARAFYEDVLGLRQIPRPEFGLGGVWYRAGDTEVHLIVTPEGADVGNPPAATNPVANHVAFGIDDYEKTVAALAGKGVQVLETSAEAGQMWIRDPDGHVIELTTGARR